jgi:hypothetical protein
MLHESLLPFSVVKQSRRGCNGTPDSAKIPRVGPASQRGGGRLAFRHHKDLSPVLDRVFCEHVEYIAASDPRAAPRTPQPSIQCNKKAVGTDNIRSSTGISKFGPDPQHPDMIYIWRHYQAHPMIGSCACHASANADSIESGKRQSEDLAPTPPQNALKQGLMANNAGRHGKSLCPGK